MRVGLVIYGPLTTVSGGFLYDRKLVEHLRAAGEEVEVISLPWHGYPRLLAHNFDNGLRSRILGLGLEVLLEDELNHPSLFRLNGGLKDIPIVSIVHHLRGKEEHPSWAMPVYKWVERRYLESVDGFVFNSRTTKADVSEAMGGMKPHVIAYPAGDRLGPSITPLRVIERASRPGPLRLLFVGNLIPRKGLHTLVSALAISGPGWKLDVVGADADRDYASKTRELVREKGLTERVWFRGALGDEDLARLMDECHVLAVPSSYEGFGIVYMEGMGFGLPSLATFSGAAREMVEYGVNGFLTHPDDVSGLAQHIMRLVQDRELLGEMGQAALRTYAAHPTWEQSAETVRRFLFKMAR